MSDLEQNGRTGLASMLAELEAQNERAQEFLIKAAEWLRESERWSSEDDRKWAHRTYREAYEMAINATARLSKGQQIVARVDGEVSSGELEVGSPEWSAFCLRQVRG